MSTDPSKIQIIRLDVPCGWCMTGAHKDCKQELVYPPKNWICGCKTCKMDEYVPKVGVEVSKKEVGPVSSDEEEAVDGT